MTSAPIITVRLKAEGRDCWHRVRVPLLKFPLLKRHQKGEQIDVAELGEIVESGWGKPPSDN